jgi:Skp family chaperone for outer membrane proteins
MILLLLATLKQKFSYLTMKKIILLAFAAIPLFSIAQDKERPAVTTSAAQTKPNDNKFAIENPEVIFIELVVGTNSAGAQTIKADFGREILTSLSDKELAKQLTEMRTMAFPSVPDAMNYLASQGYKLQQNYQTTDKEGKVDTHFLFEKRMARKQGGGDGVAKPRPERPTEGQTKPAATTRPAERTPATKPDEKKK